MYIIACSHCKFTKKVVKCRNLLISRFTIYGFLETKGQLPRHLQPSVMFIASHFQHKSLPLTDFRSSRSFYSLLLKIHNIVS